MKLPDYLRVLRKGWPLVIAAVVAGLAGGIAVTASTAKVYQASVQIFVATSGATTPSELSSGNTFTSDRVQSYTSIANSPAVTDPVIKRLKLKLTSAQLASQISASAPQNKVLINLYVRDNDPQQAALVANAVAAQFSTVVQNTDQTGVQGKSAVKLTVIHPATVPGTPIKPNKVLNLGFGLAIGLLLGLGAIALRDVLDNTIKGQEDFEPLGIPVLGMIPLDKRTSKIPVAFRSDPHSARSEAYRQLRTNLQFVDVDNPPRIIAVTSAVSGEGKSVTAINLAVALAESGARVCLIGADLRRPTLAESLGLVSEVGLTTVLIGKAPIESVLQHVGRNLSVMTSGPVPPNPSELLVSAHARDVIHRIAAQMDLTIIDTAPLLPVTDAAQIAAIADATVIVARAAKTTHEQMARSIDALAKVGERPVGVILNMVMRKGSTYEYQYGYRSDEPAKVSQLVNPRPMPSNGHRGSSAPGRIDEPDIRTPARQDVS